MEKREMGVDYARVIGALAEAVRELSHDGARCASGAPSHRAHGTLQRPLPRTLPRTLDGAAVEAEMSDAARAIVAGVRADVERVLNDGVPYKSFVVRKLTTQVVAGTRYVFTAHVDGVSGGATIDVVVVEPLPFTNAPPYLEAARVVERDAAARAAARPE